MTIIRIENDSVYTRDSESRGFYFFCKKLGRSKKAILELVERELGKAKFE